MSQENMTEKLNTFTSLVLKDAEEKRDKLIKNVESEYTGRMEAKENELLQEAYEDIQSGIYLARREANARVLQTELESKKKLILRREEIIEEVMRIVRDRIADFVKSHEYDAWFLEKAQKAVSEVGRGAKTIYIAPEDIKYKEKLALLDTSSKITVEAVPERDFIGGIRVYNTERRVAVDYSIGEMLGEQKQAFLQSSGLAIG